MFIIRAYCSMSFLENRVNVCQSTPIMSFSLFDLFLKEHDQGIRQNSKVLKNFDRKISLNIIFSILPVSIKIIKDQIFSNSI